jgi:hypothetical protein
MVREFMDTLIEEYMEAENMEELNLLTATNKERGVMNDELEAAHAAAEARINGDATPTTAPAVDQLAAKIAELEQLLAALRGTPTVVPTKLPTNTPATKPPVSRVSKKYKLLKTDVSWTTKPQVHTLMAILTAHIEVGDVVDESEIVKMMIANEDALATRQGGKRIWDYYKGTHNDGLIAHGNVEVVA